MRYEPAFRKKALDNCGEMVGCMWLIAAIAKVKVRGIGTLPWWWRGVVSPQVLLGRVSHFMNDRGEKEAGGGRGEAGGHPVFSMVTK